MKRDEIGLLNAGRWRVGVTETLSRIRAGEIGTRHVVWLSLAVALVLWASAFVGIRSTVRDISPGSLALGRFIVASAVLLTGFLLSGGLRRVRTRRFTAGDVSRIGSCSLLLVVVYNLGLNYGERTITSVTAGFLVGQLPVVSMILASVVLKERVRPLGWFGSIVGVLGSVLLVSASPGSLGMNIGALYVGVAVVGEALYFVVAKPLLVRYHSLDLNTYVTVAGTIMLSLFGPELISDMASSGRGAVLVMLYLGIFPGAIAYLCWNFAMTHLDIATVASSLYALPFVTTTLSIVILREVPSLLELFCGVVSLFGAFLVNRSSRFKDTG